jgi:transcription initiation factor TFIIB
VGRRFTRYNDRLTNAERSLVAGLREVKSLSAQLELPETTRERAAYWYREAVDTGLLKGRSLEATAAACVFIAAREQHRPVTIDWLAECSPMSASKVRHHVQVVRAELSVNLPPAHPRDFIRLIVSRLSLDMETERRAVAYMEQVTAAEAHVGKHPVAVAATVVYTAATDGGLGLTQQAVASAAAVSTVTISRQYQQISDICDRSR